MIRRGRHDEAGPPADLVRAGSGPGRPDPEDGHLSGDGLEFLERGPAVDREMRSGSGSQHQVPAQDRRPLLDGDLLEHHGLPPAVPEDGATVGRPDVAHPIGPLSQHRDQVALTVPVGDDHRHGEEPAAVPAHHLERRGAARTDPGSEEERRQPVLATRQATGTPTPVQPAQVAGVPAHGAASPTPGPPVIAEVTDAGLPIPWVRWRSTSIVAGLWRSPSHGTP